MRALELTEGEEEGEKQKTAVWVHCACVPACLYR